MRFVDINGGTVGLDLWPDDCFSLALACLVASEVVGGERRALFDGFAAAFESAGMIAEMATESTWVEGQALLDYRARHDLLTVAERAQRGESPAPAQEGGRP